MYFEGIILDCITEINENRSISGIFHLLVGKKSIQSVHDARLFQLEQYYGIYPTLRRIDLQAIVSNLQQKKLVDNGSKDGYYRITEKGRRHLIKFKKSPLYAYYRGLLYNGTDVLFFKRLHLLIQTYSNIRMKNTAFIPVVDDVDVAGWVKAFYKKNWSVTASLILYEELHKLLKGLEEREAEVLVNRLSGYHHYGMSMDQIALNYQLSIHDVNLLTVGIIHQMMYQIHRHKEDYPVLYQLIIENNNNKFITKTANQTYQLLIERYSPETIAKIRKLKLNTVYDHIVEIALYDKEFSIEPFVDTKTRKEIVSVINRCNSYKLKTIKDNCNPYISYFQIRLVLTRL
ncbi:helix-turn-helix domain-containing protein [Ornithinibacillus bavariensis]|uniref:helix-turn-helix domain-containing protein n=1 Tax=Ornithinibacillus bavariensis TaxID=545502 RepID=UPI000EC3D213|nr:hypothetical protein [Ornithinibacillus sp.]